MSMFRKSTAVFALVLSACASGGPARSPVSPATAVEAAARSSPTHDPRLRASPPLAPALPSPVVVPLDAATLAKLPREAVTATEHGEQLRCEGVPLPALLHAASAIPTESSLHGAQLTRYVLVAGRDRERVLFALAELDPTLGNRRVYLVDRCGGRPLADGDGPLRLITPDESRAARWVRGVEAITVIVAP
jgi:hypothetical protein